MTGHWIILSYSSQRLTVFIAGETLLSTYNLTTSFSPLTLHRHSLGPSHLQYRPHIQAFNALFLKTKHHSYPLVQKSHYGQRLSCFKILRSCWAWFWMARGIEETIINICPRFSSFYEDIGHPHLFPTSLLIPLLWTSLFNLHKFTICLALSTISSIHTIIFSCLPFINQINWARLLPNCTFLLDQNDRTKF